MKLYRIKNPVLSESRTMFRLFTKTISLLLLLGTPAYGQADKSGPSICDCAKNARTDARLLSQCEQTYDYNLMTAYERLLFEEKLKSCEDPSVCDCETRASKDAVLKTVCDKKFDSEQMTAEALKTYETDKKDCDQTPQKPSLQHICSCVNNPETNKDKCRDIWNISNLTPEERLLFVSSISDCIEHKDDPDFTLSICDCMDIQPDDYELKARCVGKFDINNMSTEELSAYKKEYKDCGLSYGNEITQVCNCLKGNPSYDNLSPKCEELILRLERKYEDKNTREFELFIQKLMECLMGS